MIGDCGDVGRQTGGGRPTWRAGCWAGEGGGASPHAPLPSLGPVTRLHNHNTNVLKMCTG